MLCAFSGLICSAVVRAESTEAERTVECTEPWSILPESSVESCPLRTAESRLEKPVLGEIHIYLLLP